MKIALEKISREYTNKQSIYENRLFTTPNPIYEFLT